LNLENEIEKLNSQRSKTTKQIQKVLNAFFELIESGLDHPGNEIQVCGKCTGCVGSGNSQKEYGIWIEGVYFLTSHTCYCKSVWFPGEYTDYEQVFWKSGATWSRAEVEYSNKQIAEKLVKAANKLKKVIENKIKNEEVAQEMLSTLKTVFSDL